MPIKSKAMFKLIRIMEQIRQFIFRQIYYCLAVLTGAQIGRACRFNGFTRLSSNSHISENCHFNGCYVVGRGELVIDSNFHSGFGLVFITDTHNWKNTDKLPYDDKFISSKTSIGKNVWIGVNCIILPGVSLGDNCIVAAGSVVRGTFEPGMIIAGNPGVIVGNR